MDRTEVINRLAEIIARLTDKDYPEDLNYVRAECWDIWSDLTEWKESRLDDN